MYKYKSLKINKLSIIGAGQIGPDICLHFAKNFWRDEVEINLVDISDEALSNAKKKVEKKIDKGMETGAFSEQMARAMKSCIRYTSDYSYIKGSDLVLEAATENANIKEDIFNKVESLTDEHCIYLSNSSHMQPEAIFAKVANKSRCLVSHYFFPAERNPVVEIVPGSETSEEISDVIMGFYEAIGKVPINVKSSYGYAIDPIFEGLCQLAILCLERGMGSIKEIDKMARQSLNQGVGPFTALNLTGGNPITNHGLEEMRKTHISWFRSPKSLQEMVEKRESWEIAGRGEEVEVEEGKAKILSDEFLGGYFALASYIIDRGISTVNDLDMATELALVIAPPFTMMNRTGIERSLELVKKFCSNHPEFPLPKSIEKAAEKGGWKLSRIVRKDMDEVAVLTIRRPKVLNALNLEVLAELQAEVDDVEANTNIRAMVITGFGNKAFVSGADLNMLSEVKTSEEGYQNSHTFQGFLNHIESTQKPKVCALNGFAFGGGNELALSCDARIARSDLKVVACQPEVNLGFIPGAGATQRLPRLVGVDRAAEILRTGRSVGIEEALEIGLIDKTAEGDLISEAVNFAREIVDGKIETKQKITQPAEKIHEPKDVNIGHLSKKIDNIMTRAIYDGTRMSLEEGLELESKLYGECVTTEDMRIGMENFKSSGGKQKASFVHR